MHTDSTFVFSLDVEDVVFAERHFVGNADGLVFWCQSGFGWIDGPGIREKEGNGFKVEWVIEECCIIGDVEESTVFWKPKVIRSWA